MARVSLQGITRKFSNVVAIEDITFEVPDGEFWVLVGPSGCGKSTILRTIAGLDSIAAGKLYIGDTLVNDLPARQRDVAMVFQNYALYPHMTVEDNLAFGLRMRQVEKTKINNQIREVARSLNIEHLLKRKPKQLSGGQQQRVALGRAIARQPKVFLLDEPLSNLDAQLRDDTRTELKQLHDRVGITTIYVTHDQVEAMTLADRIVVLENGKIQQIGSPQAIYTRPASRMVATFVGSPPMNILPGTYLDGNFVIERQSLPVTAKIKQQLQPTQGQSFDLGIRPEQIKIAIQNRTGDRFGSLVVEVNLVEPLGREILVRANLLNSYLALSFFASADWQIYKGDRLTIELNLEKLFCFSPDSGKTIYPMSSNG
ncbi:ABC transporter ATP-binding protein [Pleurocapsales cyanobacterium LEGE 06147]|nr:ABC transporter ATP-binding protein [Pleurocapsales cyanobacterium LEGE 06147]